MAPAVAAAGRPRRLQLGKRLSTKDPWKSTFGTWEVYSPSSDTCYHVTRHTTATGSSSCCRWCG